MYELSIVSMDEDPSDQLLHSIRPFEENFMTENEPEVKVLTSVSMLKCHDRQIQRLQRDQSKRIQDYRNLRQKLEVDTHDLQEQINGLRGELALMQRQTVEIESMRHRLVHCEEQNVQMQIHNDSEFEILRDVMQHVCGRIDRMEELQQAERDHLDHQQQSMRPTIITANASAVPQTDTHAHIRPQVNAHAHAHAQDPQQHNLFPRIRSPRCECPRCHKELAKSYVKKHLKTNRCKQFRLDI